MSTVWIEPPKTPLVGAVRPPGSKSITNRALLLAALAGRGRKGGRSRLTGALKSDDTERMSEALKAMGVQVLEPDDTSFEVISTGKLLAPKHPIFLGNAGTAVRFLAAAAALVEGTVVLDGDQHMRRRPIGPLVSALRTLGVDISAPSGSPPVTVRGSGGVNGGHVDIDASLSSQYVSAVLMMAGAARSPVELALGGPDIGARGYVDLTLGIMALFGAEVSSPVDGVWRVSPNGYHPADVAIEPDASAATYLWAAERLTGGRIDLGTAPDAFTQPDAKAYALISTYPDLPEQIDGGQFQDAVPTLAVLAAFNRRPVRFVGIANLRVKECDRILALATELSRIRPGLGRQDGDDLVVDGDPEIASRPVSRVIKTYADHRIAMSFALAALKIPGLGIADPNCVGKTWPGYWKALQSLGVDLRFT